jgi:uncharacterized protein YjbI with pentapeptide repeats
MANLECVERLLSGWRVWNSWRDANPDAGIDLSNTDLTQVDLQLVNLHGANLRGANLRKADLGKKYLSETDLAYADLREANLNEADLSFASLRNATLMYAHLEAAILTKADFSNADLNAAFFNGANLAGADLSWANLSGTDFGVTTEYSAADLSDSTLISSDLSSSNLISVNLSGANLARATLNGANLTGANLTGANLNSARLQFTKLDKTTLNDTRLWETLRAGWSIKGVMCERAYWDQAGKKPDLYALGEFEHLYSDTTRVELIYPDGITSFELNTLPALLHHLTMRYPASGIRLKSMEETGGGTKISIVIEDTNPERVDNIRAEANRSQAAQLALRDDEISRLKIQKQLLLEEVFPRMLAAAPQVHFAAPATNVALALGSRSTINAHQVHNDTESLLALLRQIQLHSADATHGQQQLTQAIAATEAELAKPSPKPSRIAAGLKIIQEIGTKVVENAAEKAITENWHTWLSQLSSLAHHWK